MKKPFRTFGRLCEKKFAQTNEHSLVRTCEISESVNIFQTEIFYTVVYDLCKNPKCHKFLETSHTFSTKIQNNHLFQMFDN